MTDSWANLRGLDLHLGLEPGGRRLRVGLERQLRDAVRSGRLVPGAALPPSRALAADLGVARNTVAEAYTQLVAEGWFTARQGSGTRVAHPPQPSAATSTTAPVVERACRYDLRAGFPDVTTFPRVEWMAAMRAGLAEAGDAALGYGPPAGQPATRSGLAEYLGRARGVHTNAHRVVVCAGFAAGLHAMAVALRAQGVRRIGVERYGHASHRRILSEAGLRLVVLDIDDEGAMPPDRAGPGAVLLTPAHQFPLGVALSARRRNAFARWAASTGAVVIEDDYDGEFRYDRRSLGAVQALAPDHIVYAGTASKTLAPGLRLGWLALPEKLLGPVQEAQAAGLGSPAAPEQLALARFLATGHYDRHVRRARLRYGQRRVRLVSGLARRVPGRVLSGMAAGLHAVLDLPAGTDETALVERARTRDLAIAGLSEYAAGPPEGRPERTGLVIGYGTPPPRGYTTALARLFALLSEASVEWRETG